MSWSMPVPPLSPMPRNKNLHLLSEGLSLRRRFQLSHWDSTIVAAALRLGCQTLYSEDLQHGVSYEGLRVINPFLAPHSFSQDP